jgi:dihydrofolate reductase
MGWAHEVAPDPAFLAWVSGNASSGGELLLGRRTYQMMEAFWPTPMAAQQMPEVAKGMNAATKHVASRTLTPRWNNSHLLQGELLEAVRDLKARDGAAITVLGSGEIATQLGAAGLVDEYQFVVIPVALGAGRSVFTQRQRLQLREHRAFANGNVVLTYGT